ncbi:hypothetical protein Pst134EA_000630 [Puccinia striiformis f. sp. tritici]|uniref:hypothetical protein n=1 Tax=Puccinia striiformis f. sp. tritici TaxID=168172 RepID=UPI002008C020|nr:hypothetical protein Pst134EA_000630 [Puccinia striiformis f. sp. tritici]KAH9473551.1 hypothetical protein Pst134EA_000630 [Puccinia striiformis f. sp. tritici]
MWQGLSTTSPDPMANCYEQRIRQLEETVRLLLARSRVTWPPLVSSAAQAGLFRYSVDRGLVPLLSEEMIRSLTVAQPNHCTLYCPLTQTSTSYTNCNSSATNSLSISGLSFSRSLRKSKRGRPPQPLSNCRPVSPVQSPSLDRLPPSRRPTSTISSYIHVKPGSANHIAITTEAETSLSVPQPPPSILTSIVSSGEKLKASAMSPGPQHSTRKPPSESDTAATFPADSMAKLITPAPTLDRVNCLDSPSPTIVPNTPQCPPTADSTVSSLVSATPWGFSSSSDRSTDTRSRSRSSLLQLTRRQSSSLLKSEHPTTSVLASAPSSTTDNSRSHLEFAVTTVTCIEGTASGVLDPSPGLIDPNDVHSSVVTNFTQHDIQSGDVLCATPSTECSTTLSESICATIWEGYDSDPFCLSVRTILPLRNDCTKVNGLLFLNNRLVIPADAKLRRSLIAKTHHRLGHLDHLDTATDLCQEFFWPHMTDEVEQFVRDCKTSPPLSRFTVLSHFKSACHPLSLVNPPPPPSSVETILTSSTELERPD